MAAVWGAVLGMVAGQLIGMVWYSKLLMGKPWMRATFPGKTWDQITQMQKQTFHVDFIVGLISQLFLILAIHYVIGPYLGVKTVDVAVKVGLGLTLLAALIDVPHCAYSQRSVVAFIIDHCYNGLVFVCACVSFVYFR